MADYTKYTNKEMQAITLAQCITNDNIAIVGTAGTAPAATGYIDEGFYHNDTYTAEERAVNIEEAKALLEEAGYGDGLTLNTTYMQETETVHAVVKEEP
jgi:ABC-type transport system substrate-binding protein